MSENILNDRKPSPLSILIRIAPLVVLILTFISGWAVNYDQVSKNKKELEKVKAYDVKAMEAIARMDERQKNIQEDVREIKSILRRQ